VDPCIPSPQLWNYRSKITPHFDRPKDGVIREIALALTGERPAQEVPALGEAIVLTRDGDRWITGVRSSNPPSIPTAAPVELSA